ADGCVVKTAALHEDEHPDEHGQGHGCTKNLRGGGEHDSGRDEAPAQPRSVRIEPRVHPREAAGYPRIIDDGRSVGSGGFLVCLLRRVNHCATSWNSAASICSPASNWATIDK